MKNIRIFVFITSFFLLPASCVFAAFKDIGWGARPAGMGNTFVAISNDANCTVFNPAGMALMKKQELDLSYTKPFLGLENVDLSLAYLSYVYPMGTTGSFGLAVTNFNGSGLYRESMYQLGYARNVYTSKVVSLSAGVNVKYLSHAYIWDDRTKAAAAALGDDVVTVGDSKGAPSADVGLIAALPGHWTVGFAAKNVNQPDLGLTYVDKVPAEYTTGAAYKIPYWKGMDAITLAVDASSRNQDWGESADKTNIHFGAEAWFATHSFAARVGGNKNEVTMGASMNKRLAKNLSFQLDYAFIWSLTIDDNSGSHRLGISLRF